MKYKIKDLKHIHQDNITAQIINETEASKSDIAKLIKGIVNRKNITLDTLFDVVEYYEPNDVDLKYGYVLLADDFGNHYIIREDNIEAVPQLNDKYEMMGIKNIIKQGNQMILVSDGTFKDKTVIIERRDEDKDDTVKALMICLLKRAGYSIDHIYDIADTIKDRKPVTVKKEVKKDNKVDKPSEEVKPTAKKKSTKKKSK